MHGSASTRRAAARSRRRSGAAAWGLTIAVPVLLLLSATAWHLFPKFFGASDETGPTMHRVRRGEFVREIIERGNVESAENIEIKCEVRSHGKGTTILWVIPEGTHVEPVPDWEPDPANPDEDPPDLLVKLDASALENQWIQQQIECFAKEVEVIEMIKNLDSSRHYLTQYLEDSYKQEKQAIESRIFVAQGDFSRAQHHLEYDSTLLAKGYATALTVERDRFAAEKARKDWEAARTDLRVLEDYKRPKFETERRSDIEICIAALEAKETVYQLNLDKLALIEEQIAKCTIRAPQAGQVVYANERREWGEDVIIEEGIVVRQHQVLIRLPDPGKMQVKGRINEATVTMVQEGMPVRIYLDAFSEVELTGSVQRVNEYPEASFGGGTSAKEYETTIEIDGPPEDEAGEPLELRSGMTVEVKLRVQTLPDVIQVPVEAVLEHGKKHYCVQRDGESFRLRKVTLGSSNDKNVVIREGLEVGEQVVLEAASYRDEFGLPQLPVRDSGRPLMHQVQRGEFVHEITERGNLDSADNVEIKCEVQRYGTGSMILWVIPEGTHVEPVPDWEPDPDNPDEDPPDLLVKLDASWLEDQRTQEQIWCRTIKSVVTREKNNLELARIALEEYVKGSFEQEKQKIQSRVFVAHEYFSRARQDLEYDEALLAQGYVTELIVRADRFAVEKTRKDWEAARTELKVLQDYNRPKTEKSLRAGIETAAAKVESEKKNYQVRLKRLAWLEKQIAKCTIRTPQAGQVVYANEQKQWGQQIIIEEGTTVRENQVIIRLPDSTRMQVTTKIDEAAVATVQEGMPVRIRLYAFSDVELTGSITKINSYPEPSSRYGPAVKEYETTIGIDELPEDEAGEPLDLRPGMSAEAKICVKTLRDVIHVPAHAVFKHGQEHYCAQQDGESFRLRKVTTGLTNDKTVVILEGLEVGEQIVLGAAFYRDELDLPQLEPETPGRPSATPAEQPSVAEKASPKGPAAKGKGVTAGPGAK